jgi:glycosyltransferase involved in cell wall biosynthesis
MANSISIVLPAYNEEKNIGFVIDEILDFFGRNNLLCQIVVVNDGSQDKTAEVLNKYKNEQKIVAVTHQKNLGYGSALKSGFAKATGDFIFFMDSDRQFDIKDVAPFIKKIENADFVAGYRKNRMDSWIRILYAKIFGLACLVFFGVKVKDIDCAFKLFKKEVLQNMDLVSNGALINLEIFAKAKKKGYKFVELPVNHFRRTEGRETGGSLKVVVKAVIDFAAMVCTK